VRGRSTLNRVREELAIDRVRDLRGMTDENQFVFAAAPHRNMAICSAFT
jgi:hypothetical protein